MEVANVDEEINQAMATLRRLLAKRCDLRSEQNRIHGSLIHRLPVELSNYIFELLLPSRNEWGEISRCKPRRIVMPSYLASICRSWRDIAWTNPSLWSAMHITVGKTSDPSSDIDFVQGWILRSQTLPLTLHIHSSNEEGVDETVKGVIDAISQCSNRWHSLSLQIPFRFLHPFHHSNVQYHRLRRLRILVVGRWQDDPSRLPLLNPSVSPERIEIRGVSFQSLKISWSHLSFAEVGSFGLEDITQLFQHASQMTSCHISLPLSHRSGSLPSIIHQRLKKLRLSIGFKEAAAMLLGSLTLPSLQEFHTNEMALLHPAYLPALVHRSSCPLTMITLSRCLEEDLDDLQPLSGVTDLVLGPDTYNTAIRELLLEKYFPDLRRLTLRPDTFWLLWSLGFISKLLDCNRPGPGAHIERRIHKIIVEEAADIGGCSWKSYVGTELNALNITFKENGFEITCMHCPKDFVLFDSVCNRNQGCEVLILKIWISFRIQEFKDDLKDL
jgi:hypothetical protein